MHLLDDHCITLGVCYYPEHWDPSLWREDLDRMLKSGLTVIRIAEFAWNKIEPREGVFDFSFFDGFLDLCDEVGMQVILGTPTATPPIWLTEKYPEVCNCLKDGTRLGHGMRRHYNYNSPVYQEKTRIIVTQMAKHYGKRTCVIGWQIDNEFNCEIGEFYSDSDTIAFRRFLREKYGSLEELNSAWGTAFWNQTYTDWEEVHLPLPTPSGGTNPHQLLDYKHFISDSVYRYARLQSEILRQYRKRDDFITTNGIFGDIDYNRLVPEVLDFITYDSYPNFGYCLDSYDPDPAAMRDRHWSWNLAKVRAISPVFGIMEQQSGANGWDTRMEAPTPRPGQIRLWTLQSIAHGADYVGYFRWRTSTIGTEIYWHGILDYSGRENRRLREIREIARQVKRLQALAGSRSSARVGNLQDYDNLWDAECDHWHARVQYRSEDGLFAALQHTHTSYDIVTLTSGMDHRDLEQYEVLFYPHPVILEQEQAEVLTEYVRHGGNLIFGCRSAYKDANGRCVQDFLPGVIAELTGTDIPEYSFIAPDAGEVSVTWEDDAFPAAVFTDLLEPLQGGE
nr:beta-galactosidase [Lachnospiraceae bacterium]